MGKLDLGIVMPMFISMCIVGSLATILDVSLSDGQCMEFVLAMVVYHLLLRTTIYKTYFLNADDNEKVWLLPKDNPLPFIGFGVISIFVSALVMMIFDVHLSNKLQNILEIVAICSYQYIVTYTMTQPSI